MKVSELARRAEVTAETVRHYVREGLLEPTRDPHNNYQLFDENALARLRFVLRARTLGFSLKEIRDIVAHADQGDSPCPLVRDMLSTRLPEVRARIVELQGLAERMEQALSAWSSMPDGSPDGHTICQLIEHWNEGTDDCCSTRETRQRAREQASN